jgi:hypothetical protein
MISKTYFVSETIKNFPQFSLFSWIDIGILHIISEDNRDIFMKTLDRINCGYNLKDGKIRIPGCYELYTEPDVLSYRNNPIWVFCGVLLRIAPRNGKHRQDGQCYGNQ